MNKNAILTALSALGQRANAAGIKLDVSIYGGAAFLLAYNSREATKDIDAILRPKREGQKLVLRVARELGLPEDWLNSNVSHFLSPLKESKRALAEIEDETGLIIHVPTARYLLAMKALACRRPIAGYRGDIDDLQFLIQKMGILSVEEIQDALNEFYPDDILKPNDIALLKSLITESK